MLFNWLFKPVGPSVCRFEWRIQTNSNPFYPGVNGGEEGITTTGSSSEGGRKGKGRDAWVAAAQKRRREKDVPTQMRGTLACRGDKMGYH